MSSNFPMVIDQAARAMSLDLAQYNVLLPTQSFGQVLGEYDKVTLEVVRIDPDPKEGEVSEIGGKLALGRVPLEKIGSAVGIIWDPDRTTILESSETKSRAKATGALRKPNGEWIVLSEEKTVDLSAFEEEQALSIEEKAEKGNPEKIVKWHKTEGGKSYPEFAPWASESEKATGMDRMLRKAMLQFRKFKDERAMTGAKERCIRALLALKASYSREELSKPFVFPRVTLDASKMLASPEMRSAAVERMTGATSSIFGRSRSADQDAVHTIAGTTETIEAPPEETPEDDGFADAPPAEHAPFAKPAAAAQPEPDPRDPLRAQLNAILADKAKREVLSRKKDKATEKNAVDLIASAIDDEAATVDSLTALLTRCGTLFGAKGGAA